MAEPKDPARVLPFTQKKTPKRPRPRRPSFLDRPSGLRLDVQVTVKKPDDPKC